MHESASFDSCKDDEITPEGSQIFGLAFLWENCSSVQDDFFCQDLHFPTNFGRQNSNLHRRNLLNRLVCTTGPDRGLLLESRKPITFTTFCQTFFRQDSHVQANFRLQDTDLNLFDLLKKLLCMIESDGSHDKGSYEFSEI